jgi:hypothetical protein
MLAAYLVAAGVVFAIQLITGRPPYYASPVEGVWELFVVFPMGLGRFFKWDFPFGPHLIYFALTVQLIIPRAKVYWALLGVFVLLLCFNVRGCFQPLDI